MFFWYLVVLHSFIMAHIFFLKYLIYLWIWTYWAGFYGNYFHSSKLFLTGDCSYVPQQLFLHWKRLGNLLKPLTVQHLPSKCIWKWHYQFRTQLQEPTKEMWDFSLQGAPWPRGLGNSFFPNGCWRGPGAGLALSQGMPKSFRNLLFVKPDEGRASLNRSRLAELTRKRWFPQQSSQTLLKHPELKS